MTDFSMMGREQRMQYLLSVCHKIFGEKSFSPAEAYAKLSDEDKRAMWIRTRQKLALMLQKVCKAKPVGVLKIDIRKDSHTKGLRCTITEQIATKPIIDADRLIVQLAKEKLAHVEASRYPLVVDNDHLVQTDAEARRAEKQHDKKVEQAARDLNNAQVRLAKREAKADLIERTSIDRDTGLEVKPEPYKHEIPKRFDESSLPPPGKPMRDWTPSELEAHKNALRARYSVNAAQPMDAAFTSDWALNMQRAANYRSERQLLPNEVWDPIMGYCSV